MISLLSSTPPPSPPSPRLPQELEFGQGELLGYDYVSIESDLRDLLLPSAQPFGLAHRDFAFKGEIRERAAESTMIAMLSNRVRQIKLPDTVFEQVGVTVFCDALHLLRIM